MKIIIKYIFTFNVVLISLNLISAQDSTVHKIEKKSDSKWVEYKVKRYYQPVKTRYFLFDLGVNTYIEDIPYVLDNGINPFEQEILKSVGVNMHIYMQRVHLIGRSVNLLHGLTAEFRDYAFLNPVTLPSGEPELLFLYDEGVDYRKNRLRSTYLSIPVMINFESNPRKSYNSFHISAGVYGGIRLTSSTKQKSKSFGKVKVRDDFNLNKFEWGFRGQIGFGPINLFGTLAMTEMFDPDQDSGTQIYPMTLGIQIVPY